MEDLGNQHEEAKSDTKMLRIDVTDSGIGITKENIKKLFVHFFKVKDENKMNENGCGLGLAICQKIARRMGGYIKVQSKIN